MFERPSLKIAEKVAPFNSARIISLDIGNFSSVLTECCISDDLAFLGNEVFHVRGSILEEAKISDNRLIGMPVSLLPDQFVYLGFLLALEGVDLDLCSMTVSDDHFKPLKGIDIKGITYNQKPCKKEASDLFGGNPKGTPHLEKKGYPKAYVKNERSGKRLEKIMSIWDLIYPILLPPLNLEFTPQADLPYPLYEYQKAGINFLLDRKEALLADEMGTGKTVMSTVAMRVLLRQGQIKNALIVCPLSILGVWIDHLNEWAPDLQLTIVRGHHEDRKIDWLCPAHIYLTTYDTLRLDILGNCKYGPAFKKDELGKFDLVILDEAQNIKVPTSDRSRSIKKLKTQYRWALSGTPLENRVEDLISVFNFISPNLFDSYIPSRDSIKEIIAPHFLRRRKKDVLKDLPAKVRQEIWLELDEDQRAVYDQVEKEGVMALRSLGDKITKPHIFGLLTKLKQICNFAPGKVCSPKTEALLYLVEEITANNQKVLVFSNFKREGIDKIQNIASKYGTVRFCGDMSDKQRETAITDFKNDPFKPIFLGQVRTAGLGLNLTEASYVVHFDHWWNPAVMWQAEDRAHRNGQKNKVNIYSFWMKNTVEERIYNKLKEKGLLFEEIIDGLAEKDFEKLMTSDDWYDVLGIKVKEDKQKEVKSKMGDSDELSLVAIVNKMQNMDPLDFEKLICSLFLKFGFIKAKVTQRSHDGGIDIAALKVTVGGEERTVVQCKRRNEAVGIEYARELLGVLDADPSLAKGFLVASGSISDECKSFCRRNGKLAYLDGVSVANYIREFGIKMEV